MPTLLVIKGLRFFFYSNENNEPAHVHVAKGNASGKIWLEPSTAIAYLIGFSNSEENDILDILASNSEIFKRNGMSTLKNNQYDAIEKLIFDEGLRIDTIDIHPELDLMIVILNTKAVLHQNLSSYSHLKKAEKSSLLQYELIADGTGVHWPMLDEDLSLKGFLHDELRKVVKGSKDALAA